MSDRTNERNFDRDLSYRRPTAWQRVKELSPFCAELCGQVEALCREGPINCPRECLYAALHHFALVMTDAQRMAAWTTMNRSRERERIARGEIRDYAEKCEPGFWQANTLAEVLAQAMASSIAPKQPAELRIIEKADYQHGDEPGSRCYWNLDIDQGVLWLCRDTPDDVRQEIIAEATQIFAASRRAD